jgi:steroid delta-isomerase-like uncharacterized protein
MQMNERTVRRVFADVVNRGDFSLIDELYTSDVRDHDPFPGAPAGRDGVRYTLGHLRKMYPDIHVAINALTCHDDRVTLLLTWTGTFEGTLDAARSGRRVNYDGIVVFRLENGRIAERWARLDVSRMLRQLQVDKVHVQASGLPLALEDSDTSTMRALGALLEMPAER